MALIHCKECGKDVSTKDNTCPHCGANLKDNKRFYEIIKKIIEIVIQFT